MKKVEKSSSAGTADEQSANTDVQHGNQPIAKPSVRRSADIWWKSLQHEKKVKYASEILAERGQSFRYDNNGLIHGFTLTDATELFKRYAQLSDIHY